MPVGTNLPKVGSYNRSVVITTIQMAGRISRTEIAARTGLTAQTVSVIVRKLLDERIVAEDGMEPSSGGKPRQALRVEPSARYAIGVHVDPLKVTCGIVDLTGELVVSSSRSFALDVATERIVAATAKSAQRHLEKLAIPRSKVLGVGVACPGPIDQNEGMVTSPPRQDRWTKVPVKQLFEEATGLPVIVDNDGTASAVGERWAGVARDTTDFAYLYLGAGIGGGVFGANQVYRGAGLNAGEFGHIVVDPRGGPCYCGRRGCLEAMCRPAAIVAEAVAKLEAGRPSSLRKAWSADASSLTHAAICEAALAGDRLARSVIDKAAGYLATAAVDIVNVFDPELVVIGGPAAAQVGEIYRERIERAVDELALARTVHRPRVLCSLRAYDSAAIGAASLVLHIAFAPNLTLLLEE